MREIKTTKWTKIEAAQWRARLTLNYVETKRATLKGQASCRQLLKKNHLLHGNPCTHLLSREIRQPQRQRPVRHFVHCGITGAANKGFSALAGKDMATRNRTRQPVNASLQPARPAIPATANGGRGRVAGARECADASPAPAPPPAAHNAVAPRDPYREVSNCWLAVL